MRTFCNELASSIGGVRVCRGKSSMRDLYEQGLRRGFSRLIIVYRWKGNVGSFRMFKILPEGLFLHPPIVYVRGVKLRRDFGYRKTPFDPEDLVVSWEGGEEAKKLASSFSEFLEIDLVEPPTEEPRLLVRQVDSFLSFSFFHDDKEVGPRVKVKHLIWEPIATKYV